MTFHLGHPTPDPLPGPARRFRPASDDGIPPEPPPEALAAVDAAWERGRALAAEGRELAFGHDAQSGRLVVELRTLAGEVLETLTPTAFLAFLDGPLN